MGFDPFSRLSNSQRTTRIVLLAIILLTLPCYCLGAVLLASAPTNENRAPGDTRPTLGGATTSPGVSPTWTPFRTATFTPQGGPLQPTPLQFYPPVQAQPTNPVYIYITWTPSFTPTNTYIPVPTLAPTLTWVPTYTLAPTATLEPSPFPTDLPQPTEAPLPTADSSQPDIEPSPTQETGL